MGLAAILEHLYGRAMGRRPNETNLRITQFSGRTAAVRGAVRLAGVRSRRGKRFQLARRDFCGRRLPFVLVDVQIHAGLLVVSVSGDIDASCSTRLLQYLQDVEVDGLPVVVDLAAVTFIDSAGVRALLQANEDHGGSLRLRNPHRNIQRILEITLPDFDFDGRELPPPGP